MGLLAQQHPTTFQSTLKENNIYVGSKHTSWTISNLVVDSVKKHVKKCSLGPPQSKSGICSEGNRPPVRTRPTLLKGDNN